MLKIIFRVVIQKIFRSIIFCKSTRGLEPQRPHSPCKRDRGRYLCNRSGFFILVIKFQFTNPIKILTS
jgi:hypothetical protein